ncbi:MAG: DNRLRE domain-containing protein [Candidatus Pacearchaeota archaeon]
MATKKINRKEKNLIIYFLVLFGLSIFLADFSFAQTVERGAYWERINGTTKSNLKIYNNIINYYNGSSYNPITYGLCINETYCFIDWNGLIYRVSNDLNKSYINLYDSENNYITSFGFGITGYINGNYYRYTTLNFTWTWSGEYNNQTKIYVFRAYNNYKDFNWTQEYIFYSNQSMKIKNIIKNNLGVTITNTTFWYIQTIDKDKGIWFNGTRYVNDTYEHGYFDSFLPLVKFEDDYIFKYDDLLNNGFNVTDFYLGNGSVIGVPSVRIIAIGITKNNGNFSDGADVIIDPNILITGADGGGDAEVRGDYPNKNYGSETDFSVRWGTPKKNSYLKFNISSIPNNQIIENATLCAYLYNDQSSQTIGAYHVYKDFDELNLTWNNQPCGTNFDNSTNCNLTYDSFITNDGYQDGTWQCWNILNIMRKEYNNGSKLVKIVLHTKDTGNADFFYSKEYSNSSFWPYLNITYYPADVNPPYFINLTENPVNASIYSSNQIYYFNVTINESNLNVVGIEFNGINYTGSQYISNVSNVFIFNKTGLAAGTYSYYWWANDSLGNFNKSQMRYYLINKSYNNVTLISSVGWSPITYGTEVTFECFADYGIPNLYINNNIVSNPINIILEVGTHNIKCNISESQNYTSGTSQGTLTVNKADSKVSLTFDKTSPQTYGVFIIPNCSVVTGVGTPELFMNGESVSSGVPLYLGAGNYNFNCSLNSSYNYSYSENLSVFVINKASTLTNVLVNPASPIVYGNFSNFSCYNNMGFVTVMDINGVDKSSEKGLNIIRGAGVYLINCSFAGNSNYSSSSEQIEYLINKSLGNISLFLNGIEDNLTIEYPQQYNITAVTPYGNISLYMNGIDVTSNNTKNVTPFRENALYNITAISTGDENHSESFITRWLNVTLDEIPPEINIFSPQEGNVYGNNVSLELNYIVLDSHLESCWYNLNNGENKTILNCENITFNISSDGVYTLYLYANDSLGNIGKANVTFSIFVGYPSITLISPIGIYYNSGNISFRYVPSDLDLTYCDLWADFSGVFSINQTNNTPLNGVENVFEVKSISDGTYKWNIGCNDSLGHYVLNGNKTFYVDTVSPSVTIIEPQGIKTSWIGIPFSFSIFDNSPVSCKYNVNWATGGVVIPNTSILNCNNPISFNLSSVGDYVLNLFVTDYAGNVNITSSSFSISTITSPPSSGGSSSGGISSGGVSFAPAKSYNKNNVIDLEISNLGNIVAQQGTKKTISLNVKNIGNVFLNNCRIMLKGNISSWFYFKQMKGISPGESASFVFDLSVPEGIFGDYSGELEIICDEINKSQEIKVTIPKKLYSINIKEIKYEKKGLNISYILDTTDFYRDKLEVDIWLVDSDGNEINRIKDNFDVKSSSENSIIDRNIFMELPKGMSGVYTIYFAYSDDLKNYVKQPIVLGKSSTTGFSILNQPRNKMIIYLIFVFVLFVIIFIIMWGNKNKERLKGVKLKKKIKK